jgi:hypothetical protein
MKMRSKLGVGTVICVTLPCNHRAKRPDIPVAA